MILGILYLVVLVAMFEVISSPGCVSCGKKIRHAQDCWRRR